MPSDYDALLAEPPVDQKSPYDALLPAPVDTAPIIPRSGAQMESLGAREFLATPESTAAGDIRGTGDQPVIPIPRIPQQEGVVAQLGAGAVNAAANLAETFETPQLIASLPVMPMKLTQLLFGGQALSDIKTAYEEAARPETTVQKGLELGGRALTDALFGVGMVHGAVGGLAEPRSLTPKPDGLTESLFGKPEVQPEQSQLLEKVNEGLAAGEQPSPSVPTPAAETPTTVDETTATRQAEPTEQPVQLSAQEPVVTVPSVDLRTGDFPPEQFATSSQEDYVNSQNPTGPADVKVYQSLYRDDVKNAMRRYELSPDEAKAKIGDLPSLNVWVRDLAQSEREFPGQERYSIERKVREGEYVSPYYLEKYGLKPSPVSEGGAGTQALISKPDLGLKEPVSQTSQQGQAAPVLDPNKFQIRFRAGSEMSSPIEIRDVNGTSVKINEAPDHEFFVYKSDAKTKPWHLAEKSTGLALNEAASKAEAISRGKEQIASRGLEEFRKDIDYAKSQGSIFTTPRKASPVSKVGVEPSAPVSKEAASPKIESGVAPTEAGQPGPPSGVTALTPDSQPPEVGPNVKGFEKVYGTGEIKAGDSVTPDEIFRSGQADLASGKDPYAIADRARTGDVSPKEIGLLAAEHDRLLHEAAAAEGTAEYEAKYQQAKDFAQNMLKPAGTKWHQTGMGLQVKAPIDLSSLTGFRAAFEERFSKEMTPDQASAFSQIAKDVARAKAEDAIELGRTAERVRQRFKGVKDISFEDAVKSLHDEIASKLKDCNL